MAADCIPARRFATPVAIRDGRVADAVAIRAVRRHFRFRYRSPARWLGVFRDCYGPIRAAFAALDGAAQVAIEADIVALLEQLNVAGTHALVVPGKYAEAVITKR